MRIKIEVEGEGKRGGVVGGGGGGGGGVGDILSKFPIQLEVMHRSSLLLGEGYSATDGCQC